MTPALEAMRLLGIPVTWSVVRAGWEGPGTLGRQLTLDDVRSFADERVALAAADELADAATLSTVTNDSDVEEVLQRLSPEVDALAVPQWRALILSQLLAVLPQSPIDALCELTTFWSAFGYPPDSPHVVQGRGNIIRPEHYYTSEMLARLVGEHREWLDAELAQLRRERSEKR